MTTHESGKARRFTGKSAQKQGNRPQKRLRTRPATPDYLERAGLYYLQRFSSSAANFKAVMQRKVRRRGLADDVTPETAEEWIDDLTARFVRVGLLDDRAYATARAQSLHRKGRPARFIRQALAAKGIDSALIEEVETTLFAEMENPDLLAAVAFARRRRFGPFRRDRGPLEPAVFDKMLAAFARAGFSYGIARQVMDADDEAAIDVLLTGIDH